MLWKQYELEDTLLKARGDTKLWQSEKGIVEISEDTLAIPIRIEDQHRGFVFHGKGRLLLDTIVDTERGAIGKPVEKELDNSFLMLGNAEEVMENFVEADEEYLAERGYEDRQGFADRAENLCNLFFRDRWHSCGRQNIAGSIFAFPHENGELDILLTKGSKIVYKSLDMTFVSNEDKIVMKSPSGTVCCSYDGGSVFIKGKSVILRR